MAVQFEDYSPVVKQQGFNLGKVAVFSAAVSITAALTLTAALTGTTGYFSDVLSSEVSVSSTQFHTYGTATFSLGKSGQTVSSVPIKINGVVGEDITATSNPKTGTSTIFGIGCLEFVDRNNGKTHFLTATANGVALVFQDGDCPW